MQIMTRSVIAMAVAGLAVFGAAAPANASNGPGCDAFGWTHPMCAGGAWDDETASQEWGPDSSTRAGIDAVTEVPNIDGGMSMPGSPGAV